MTVAVIGLGGNIGEPRTAMAVALDRLTARTIRIDVVSSLYQTPPWGKTDQASFLNAAARIETSGTASALLDHLLAVEASLGRQRAEPWGPRSIDLDILVFGEEAIDEPGLHVPHPRLTERAFALLPLAELMPDLRLGRQRVAEWLGAVDKAGIVKIAGPDWYRPGGSVETGERGPDGAQ